MQYKILIVDDEPMLTELLADYLGDMGYLPFMATDSVQAMEKLKKSPARTQGLRRRFLLK